VDVADEESTPAASSSDKTITQREKTPPAERKPSSAVKPDLTRSDLLEIARLKSELRRTETDRDSLRISLDNERKEKESLAQRLDQLREDLTEKRKEVERREAERHELQSQCNKLLHMVDERDRKVEHSEEERDRLRAKIAQVESDLRSVEDERREATHKMRELEQSLRKAEELNGKLENKLFHEDRRLAAKIRLLEEQLAKAQSAAAAAAVNSSAVLGDINLSGNSSDREFAPRVGANDVRELPNLWSDVEGLEMEAERCVA